MSGNESTPFSQSRLTLRGALGWAGGRLGELPELRADASRDALLLLLHVMHISRASLLADPDRALTEDQQSHYEALIQRRLASEPIQYITGEQEFYGLAMQVTPSVLIPRPETEHLVEAVLGECDPSMPLEIVDVGTGSGAIAIALAHHLTKAEITAVDISPAALAVAASNAARHELETRIRFFESDLLGGLPEGSLFDVVVSNPPYVPAHDRDTLHAQVRDFEPGLALYGGTSGLEIYQRLIPQARLALKRNGLLALEIGHDQCEAVTTLLEEWRDVRFVRDLQQIPRVILGRRPE